MIIKQADDHSTLIEHLSKKAEGTGLDAKRAATELRYRKAGLKGEAESAYLLDFNFGASPNWAVIHDLRLEHHGRVAQIDHLLINRFMEIYVLETKHFHAGIKITEHGEFLRWNSFKKTLEGMPSPLEQNERHLAILGKVVNDLEWPTRLGMRLTPSLHAFVLVSPSSRIDRHPDFDSSRVLKADQIKSRIMKDLDLESGLSGLFKATKLVSADTVESIARQLVAHHVPLPRSFSQFLDMPQDSPNDAPSTPAKDTAQETVDEKPEGDQPPSPLPVKAGPACKSCQGTEGSILYGKYGYYFKCKACGANTAMRFTCQPGHRPRLRKEREHFYRCCEECGTDELYFQNTA